MTTSERKLEVARERQLLAVLVAECPDQASQERAGRLYNELLSNPTTHKDIMRILAGALYDGLAYGNWP